MPIDNLNGLSNDLRNIEREFKHKIEPYRTDLWKYCYKLTRSPWDAEDLVQETLLKSLSMLAKLFQPVNTKAYLFKIATNLWIDQVRKHHNVMLFDEHLFQQIDTDEDLHLYENIEILVKELTPIQYVVLLLADSFQYKGKEIAEILATTEGAVHTNLSRARDCLRKSKSNETKKHSSRKSINREVTTNSEIDVLLKGFREKDPVLIASILDDNVVTDITHSGVEMGKKETLKNSLKDWTEIVHTQHIIYSEYVELWGRPVILEFERKQDQKLYLNNIHFFEIIDSKVTYWKFYCFSWDIMQLVARELEVGLNAEYFYHIF
ncbi:RNA polymerase sigma factor [Bacillus salitolerans]|uniref:RNA polymerase sigma factor n=1 Tax=Bacillus salitolerans TaxID=1437434 RepID=A0ABW4LR53_9BACI